MMCTAITSMSQCSLSQRWPVTCAPRMSSFVLLQFSSNAKMSGSLPSTSVTEEVKPTKAFLQITTIQFFVCSGAGEATENTIDAYERFETRLIICFCNLCVLTRVFDFFRAVKAGTQLLELDVHLTKDNQVVVVHDPNLNRLTGRDMDVTTLRFDELPLLQRQLAVSFAKGNLSDVL